MTWVKHKVLRGTPMTLNSGVGRLESGSGVTGRLRTLCDALFLPRTVMARLYPAPASSWRIFAYYPVRAKGLWVRYRQTLWKLVTRDRQFVADAQKEARLRAYLGWQ
jgi:hypothetical protein